MSSFDTDYFIIRRIWALSLSKYRSKFFWVVLLQLAYIPLALLQPLPLKVLADQVIGNKPLPAWASGLSALHFSNWLISLCLLVIIALSISGLTQLHNVLAWMWATKIEQIVVYEFRSKLLERIFIVPLRRLERIGTADLLYKVTQDADSAKELTVGLTRYLVSFVSILGFAIVMLTINPLMTLLAFSPVPFAFLLLSRKKVHIRRNWNNSFALANQAFNIINESLILTRVIRVFNGTSFQAVQFESFSKSAIKRTVVASQAEATLDASLGVLFTLGQSALIVLGAYYIRRGVLSFGELLVFHSYTLQLYEPLERLSRMLGDIQQHLSKAARALTIFDLPCERSISPNNDKDSTHGSSYLIEFKQVSYSCSDNLDLKVLSNVCIAVPYGSIVGITGPSGCGKSTLIDLLLRFDEPTYGSIFFEGVDISNIDPNELRGRFSVMTQDSPLFASTIATNVRYGCPNATDEDVWWALEMAAAKAMVTSMPLGIHTTVGERGFVLSGGQRQRVAIARTILKDASVLVMDEPTSALDSQAEMKVLDGLHALIKSKRVQAVLLVSHSPAVLAACDRIFTISRP